MIESFEVFGIDFLGADKLFKAYVQNFQTRRRLLLKALYRLLTFLDLLVINLSVAFHLWLIENVSQVFDTLGCSWGIIWAGKTFLEHESKTAVHRLGWCSRGWKKVETGLSASDVGNRNWHYTQSSYRDIEASGCILEHMIWGEWGNRKAFLRSLYIVKNFCDSLKLKDMSCMKHELIVSRPWMMSRIHSYD